MTVWLDTADAFGPAQQGLQDRCQARSLTLTLALTITITITITLPITLTRTHQGLQDRCQARDLLVLYMSPYQLAEGVRVRVRVS